MQFTDVITDPAQFRELMGEPPPPCVAKTLATLDRPAALPMPVDALGGNHDRIERLY